MALGLLNPFRAAIGQLTGGLLGTSTQQGQNPSQPQGQSPAPVAASGARSQATSANAGQQADDIIQRRRNAISGMESGGRYDIIGPTHPKYGRALGKYQVMESNLPSWSRRVLGRVYTPNEFLADKDAQDAIFDTIFGQDYVPKYGEEGAARAWHGGPGGVTNPKADALGTRTADYGRNYVRRLGGKGQRSTAGQTPAKTPQMAVDNAPQTGVRYDPQNPRGFVEQAVADAGISPGGSEPANPKNAWQQWLHNLGKNAGGSGSTETPPPPIPEAMGGMRDPIREERFQRVIEQVLTKKNSTPLRQMSDTDKIDLLVRMGRMTATPFGKGPSNG